MNTKEHREWLKKVMEDNDLNEAQWAAAAEISTPNVLYNYFSGRSKSISHENCAKLAPVIGLTVKQMRMGPKAMTQTNKSPEMSDAHHMKVRNSEVRPLPEAELLQFRKPTVTRIVPVYGPAAAASSETVLITKEYIVEEMEAPTELEGVRDGFIMYVSGESMRPKYRPGQLVSVHPHRRPTIEQDCVVVFEDDGNAIIKEFAGETATEWKLKQYNPEKIFAVKKSDVRSVYAIVGRPSP